MATLELPAGTKFTARYETVRRLGFGGMGEVYLAKDLILGGRLVALKFCTVTDEPSLRRFQREVRAMKLVKHQNVMPVIDEHLGHNPPFFTMPVAEHSLDVETASLVADQMSALNAVLDLCRGVEATHAQAGPHRDIKPLNVMRMQDGRVVVSDFGLVKIDPRDTTVLTRTTDYLGTPAYMAPEQWTPGGSRDADVRTDVFQLGATAYYIFTGIHPMPMDPAKLAPGLRSIIVKATSALKEKRHQTVTELREDFESYLSVLVSPKTPLETFTELLDAAVKLLEAHNQYEEEGLTKLLQAVGGFADQPDVLTDQFDKIPDKLLLAAAKNLPAALADALQHYCAALDETVGHAGWGYADTVSDKMLKFVFQKSTDPEITAFSVLACLIAGVDLNRFHAWDVFDEMLKEIKSDDEAAAVAHALKQQRRRYAGLASRLSADELHPLLRAVHRDVLAPAHVAVN